MPVQPPAIDWADFAEIRRQVLRAARQLVPDWQPPTENDPAMALLAVYAHYMELLLARLNRVPEKNLIAFLDLLGVSRLPPGAARAPVVFTPGPTAGASTFVPAGTQVATLQTETQPAVIYETAEDLNVIQTRLVASQTVEPGKIGDAGRRALDRYADQSALLHNDLHLVSRPFSGDTISEHVLYLGLPEELPVLAQKGGELSILFETYPGNDPEAFKIADSKAFKQATNDLGLLWAVSRGDKWDGLGDPSDPQPLSQPPNTFMIAWGSDPAKSGVLGPEPRLLHGLGIETPLTGRWLRATVSAESWPVSSPFLAQKGIKRIAVRAGLPPGVSEKGLTAGSGIPPDAGTLNLSPVDVSKTFPLFGPQPKPGDAFYMASREVFAQKGARVFVHFEIAPPGVTAPGVSFDDPAGKQPPPFLLRWQYHSETGWKTLGETQVTFAPGTQPETGKSHHYPVSKPKSTPADPDFTDSTLKFVEAQGNQVEQVLHQSGTVSFKLPADSPPTVTELAGQSSYWVRVLLVSGDYGRPSEFKLEGKDLVQKQDTGTLSPPLVVSISLGYSYDVDIPGVALVTQSGPRFDDRTNENGSLGPIFRVTADDKPTWYLGFERPLPNSEVTLFLSVPTQQFVQVYRREPPPAASDGPEKLPQKSAEKPKLTWQYRSGSSWVEFTPTSDQTRAFTESGVIQFVGPGSMTAESMFDPVPRYWIRVRQEDAPVDYRPVLDGVYLNAVDAVQVSTERELLLGSSNGQKNQLFQFPKAPVLDGQQVWVREPERPSSSEVPEIQADTEQAVIQVRRNEDGGDEIWVRWEETGTLRGSDQRGRHYVLEHVAGALQFGDGLNGMIPPVGRDNIVAREVQTGGGVSGNQPAGAINQLKSSLPLIAGVANPISADGGSQPETSAAVLDRGPQTVRHRGRAVTAEDYEWLARQAAGTRVARARCLPNLDPSLVFKPGTVTLVIVPEGREKKLLPSPELIREVEEYISLRNLPQSRSQSLVKLNVIGPGYVPVELDVEIVPRTLAQAERVRADVVSLFDQFFHPLTGGRERTGWPFGRDVYLSELYAELEALPGIEHVRNLRFRPGAAAMPLRLEQPLTATVDYQVVSPEQRESSADTWVVATVQQSGTGTPVIATLTEPILKGQSVSEVMLLLFQEGEQIKIRDGPGAKDVRLRAISGNTLLVDPFRVPASGFDSGSAVASSVSHSKTYLAEKLDSGRVITQLQVQPLLQAEPLGSDSSEVRLKLFPATAAGSGSQDLSLQLEAIPGTANSYRRYTMGSRLHIPDFSLPYSGSHTVAITADDVT